VSPEPTPPIVRVAFADAFSALFADRVRAHLGIPCHLVLPDVSGQIAGLPEMDVLVTLAFTREMGAAAERLKLVQVPGAGVDRIDRSALPPGAWLANAYGHETAIAEYILGAMLAWSRDLARLDACLRRGSWESVWAIPPAPPAPWPELAGKTLGILGYGRIGQGVARRARAFDMAVWAIRRQAARPETDGLAFLGGPDALDQVLERADYLVLTLPLTAATRGLLGEREFQMMKPTAVLINVARAEIVNEEALYRALAQKTIAGAVLDVWYRYPTVAGPTFPAGRAFHELPNVLMTPHVSGWTEGTLEARATLIAENIHRAARGEPPLNLIRPSD
jgi:phosphoglycerate dehydrogenase-like enzyme